MLTELARLRGAAVTPMAAVGLALAAALLTGIAGGILTTPQGLTAALGYIVVCAISVSALAAHLPHTTFGAANTVTLVRAAIAATLAGLIAGSINDALLWIAAALAAISIALDGVDGMLARQSGNASPFGARFDMEIDAVLILILCALAAASGQVDPWILLSGASRYLFLAAGFLVPALQAPLPHNERRRIICVVQGVTIAVALIPALAPPVAALIAAAGLMATAYSFAVDTVWLLRGAAEHA